MAEFKKILLVIKDSRGASQAVVTDDMQHLLLDDAVRLARLGVLVGLRVVKANGKAYLRTQANLAKKDNLKSIAVAASNLAQKVKEPDGDRQVSVYIAAYGKYLELKFERNDLLYLDGVARIVKVEVISRLKPLAKDIMAAAKKYVVDVNLLAGILIDELARIGPDDLLDVLAKLNISDTTVGLAQVNIKTARDIIIRKQYPADQNLSRSQIYDILIDDFASIQFAAAYLDYIKTYRTKRSLGTSLAELASCYSGNLKGSETSRGQQIADHLSRLSSEFLD